MTQPTPSEKSLANLKIIKTHEEAVEKGRNGGLKNTEKQKKSKKIMGMAKKKCKFCKIKCPFKEGLLAKDPHSKCKIPEARMSILEMMGNPDKIDEAAIMSLAKMTVRVADLSDEREVFKSICEFKKNFHPAKQTIETKGEIELKTEKCIEDLKRWGTKKKVCNERGSK